MIIKTLHRAAWITVGSVFLVMAIIGLLLPVIPQLPFFLVSIFCFMRCSTRFRDWIHRQKWFIHLKSRLPHRQK